MIGHFCNTLAYFVVALLLFGLFGCTSVYLTDLDSMPSSSSFAHDHQISKKSLEKISVFVFCENTKDWDRINRSMDWCRKIKKSLLIAGAKVEDDYSADTQIELKVSVRKINSRPESFVISTLTAISYYILPKEDEEIFEFKLSASHRKTGQSFTEVSKLSMKKIIGFFHKPMVLIWNYFEPEPAQINDYLSQVRYSKRLYSRAINCVRAASLSYKPMTVSFEKTGF